MKLGLLLNNLGAPGGQDPIRTAQEAENLGFDTLWSAELWGTDCFTPLAWVGAHTERIKLGTSIMQIFARTPASAAMHAVTLDYLTNGRLVLGIGVSGPQVVEGWYGQPYSKPLARTREWLQIFRKAVAREEPLTFDGEYYQLPLQEGGSGLGKPLKLIQHPLREHIPVFVAAEGPNNVKLSAELTEGWLPLFLSPYRMDIYKEAMDIRSEDFEIAANLRVVIDDDLENALGQVKQMIAFYVGGMGAESFNVHKDHFSRMGFPDMAAQIQELFLSGRREEAVQVVPDEIADEISLCGPKERIRERLGAWKDSPVTELLIPSQDSEVVHFMAEELL